MNGDISDIQYLLIIPESSPHFFQPRSTSNFYQYLSNFRKIQL